MLKACFYCGRIHRRGEACPRRPSAEEKQQGDVEAFRNSARWQRKRSEIMERDLHLCQACLHRMSGTVRQYNSRKLSVHHIRPIRTNWAERLENNNLITLCAKHHRMADEGKLAARELQQLISSSPPGVVSDRGKGPHTDARAT